ncbi:PQQ-dependent sugar dehydrogenase [Rhodococcus sp. IEGM 1408]|uniref:PQQ-dependent sugar dehydrogenase n=1 Tax=Rhodococcus sp. IEGM 1408 TaxID=3082220 RepID=UPI0029547DDA|nr:PQQ-dependent sugar dehydrogenase [Rhodococcus sp. IEGM 1408]MDV7999638.1 PQQ-dependent sugar dehydrogenase [Rhodococcus sp. IEGM 1408]
MRSGPTHTPSRGRVRSRSLTGIAAAAAVVMALPAVACAQTGSLGGGSAGSMDTSLIPPNILFPPAVGVGAGDDVPVVASPAVTATTVMDGLNIPWDVVRTPDGTILTGERGGRMVAKPVGGAQRQVAIDLPGLFRQSESGLMGMAVDAGFAQNREIHVCWSRNSGGQRDNRITTFRAADDWSQMTKVRDTLTGIPLGAEGIHSGCRLLTAPDGSIYVGTGDTYTGAAPQSRDSLAGKTLHIRPDGAPASGDSVIHTIGHRNIQGLAIQPVTGNVYSAEHGPDVDDEVNLLQAGGNYGWNPNVGGQYNQNVPMTDTGEFPDAVEAVWSSGAPTLASADIEFLQGSAWGEWEGALAMANLKTQKLVLLHLADDGRSVRDAAVLLEGDFGRLRSLTSEPDGSLLVTTSDADGKDSVFRVSPAAAPAP